MPQTSQVKIEQYRGKIADTQSAIEGMKQLLDVWIHFDSWQDRMERLTNDGMRKNVARILAQLDISAITLVRGIENSERLIEEYQAQICAMKAKRAPETEELTADNGPKLSDPLGDTPSTTTEFFGSYVAKYPVQKTE